MAEEWVKALGVDFGTVRIGLSISDDLGMLAHPLQTLSARAEDQPIESLLKIIQERGIKEIVIGMPYHSDGRESRTSQKVVKFIVQLREKLGEDFPIHEVDELSTTKTAREKLEQTRKKTKDLKKGLLDQAAASEILQLWLDQRAGAILPDIDLYPEED